MTKKRAYKIGAFILGALILTGCTKSFATLQDEVNVYSHYETSVSSEDSTKNNLEKIKYDVEQSGYHAPSEKFFDYIEERVVDEFLNNYSSYTYYVAGDYNEATSTVVTSFTKEDLMIGGKSRSYFVLSNEYSLVKYAKAKSEDNVDLWKNYDKWVEEAPDKGLKLDEIGSTYFFSVMKNSFSSYFTSVSTFITPKDYSFNGISIEGKTWGEAFSYGIIEGLLVWPIAALIFYLNQSFVKVLGVGGTVLAIFIVTLIVRGVLLLLTFKQTASQQKMTMIQPEMAKLQAKYPNSNTNQYEKQKLAQEQMNLYKKYNVNPFGMIITMIIQFPVFIAVWGAMSGSAVLRTGTIFGLSLAAPTGASILPWGGAVSVVALIIFIIMSGVQALSMLLPQYLQKKRTANISKMGKNPAQDQNAKTMKTMNIVMLVMIIFMGFQLPVAMSIYWIISAIITLLQSLIMQSISNNKKNNKKSNNMSFAKYKTKKAK